MLCIPVSVLLLGCAGTVSETSAPSVNDQPAPDTALTVQQPTPTLQKPAAAPAENIVAPSLTVDKWVGRQFVLLEILPAFRANGHHLYASPALDRESGPVDRTIACASNRLRHDPFVNRYATVEAAAPLENGEYMVTFSLDTLDVVAFAQTHQGSVEGIAAVDDLKAAKRQWFGKRVYSRRRIIDHYDSTSGAFSNSKVSINEPVTVVDVRFGTTPLPPKPIWLIVEDTSGTRGFIPINQSWTNVASAKWSAQAPWEADIVAKKPRALYDWDPYVWEQIDKHNIFIGMTAEQVRLSWQNPQRRLVSTNGDSSLVRMVYNNNTLIFRNDTLIAQGAR